MRKSTISRELRRNRGRKDIGPSRPAHKLACNRREAKNSTALPPDTWNLIEQLLREDWTLEQITFWFKGPNLITLSHEWIYQHLIRDKRSGGTLHLLYVVKKTQKALWYHSRCGQLSNRVPIEERPAFVGSVDI
uniref:Helix-turn-helix domain-containing protein n=1 Tax=Candidatus Kentrum eta TaxID=2126337 RepID=A0A450VDI7_9GAMM|nr:MAG: hypothetical protein BECKH772A_GA0070896_102681 [Candidatus Kentron sp. H]VFK02818.1 MAG: hypothetical protein BECKH772B_GA0070898_103063 [Candidatus Kentron sp. H]VFK05730.1 MAG: hypothetical protein BECKH772C_GA0070978_102983 [Candidatus Kentron sp. H]